MSHIGVFLSFLVILMWQQFSYASDRSPLTFEDTGKILHSMGYENPKIVAITAASDSGESPSLLAVYGIARRNGRVATFRQTLQYSEGLGWFYLENKIDYFRVWTKFGYQEIRYFGRP